jgi:hypothetical protein
MYLIAAQETLSADDRVTFAHEYDHALQDQQFDLNVLAPDHPDNLDRSTAVHGLIEGDAVLTMLQWARSGLTPEEAQTLGQSGDADSGLADAPLILRESLVFPYSAGYAFVQRLYADGGCQAVDAAFRDPPASTEQVLHPDKYAAREQPDAVVLPPLAPSLGGAWRELATNVQGELETRILIQQYQDRATADRASQGWGGDRFSVLTDGNRTALVLRTMWDSPQDASEFYDAYTASLGVRFAASGQATSPGAGRFAMSGGDYSVSVQRADREVLVLIGPDADNDSRLEGAFSA